MELRRSILTLMNKDAPQRRYELRETFNALRWFVRAGLPWRMLPNDVPPWELIYRQTQRWIQAGCVEAKVNDLRSIIRIAQGRKSQPRAVILDARTLQSTCESGPRAGYDGAASSISSTSSSWLSYSRSPMELNSSRMKSKTH